MSLLADLLAKVSRPDPKREVPPLLKEAVQQSGKKEKRKRRFLVSVILAVVMVAGGVGAIFMIDYWGKPGPVARVTVQATPEPVPPPPSPSGPRTDEQTASPSLVSGTAEKPAAVAAASPLHRKAFKKKAVPRSFTSFVPAEKAAGTDKQVKRPEMDETAAQDKDLYLHTARTYEKKGHFRQALADYGKVLAIDPGNYVVMNNMASACLRLGAHAEAAGHAEKALAIKPDYVPALVNLGIAYSQAGKDDVGEAYLRHALLLAPSDRFAVLNMGLLQEKKASFAKAGEFYRRLSAAGDAQGYLGLARIAEKEARIPDAIHYYQTAMSLEKRESSLWNAANERLWQLTK